MRWGWNRFGKSFASLHLSSNGNLDLDTSLNVDNDLLDNLGGGSQAVLLNSWLAYTFSFWSLSAEKMRRGGGEGQFKRTR